MVKFKQLPPPSAPAPLQLYRHWAHHRFVQITRIVSNPAPGVYIVQTLPFGSLRGGVFTAAKRLRPRLYSWSNGFMWAYGPQHVNSRAFLKHGTVYTC